MDEPRAVRVARDHLANRHVFYDSGQCEVCEMARHIIAMHDDADGDPGVVRSAREYLRGARATDPRRRHPTIYSYARYIVREHEIRSKEISNG